MTHARSSSVRTLLPILALGVLSFGSRSLLAADDGVQVALATPPPQTMCTGGLRNNLPPAARKEFPLDGTWGQVSGTSVNVRNGPSLQNAVVTTLRGGDFVKPLALCGNWMEITWPENVPLWVPKNALQLKSDSTALATAEAAARVHNTPRSASIARISRGATVTVTGVAGDWYKISAPCAAKAYVSAKYVVTGVRRAGTPPPAASPTSATAANATPGKPAALPRKESGKSLSEQIEIAREDLKKIIPGAASTSSIPSTSPTARLDLNKTPSGETEEQETVSRQARFEAPAANQIKTATPVTAQGSPPPPVELAGFFVAYEPSLFEDAALTAAEKSSSATFPTTIAQPRSVPTPACPAVAVESTAVKAGSATQPQGVPMLKIAEPTSSSVLTPAKAAGKVPAGKVAEREPRAPAVQNTRIPWVIPAEPSYEPPAVIIPITEDELPTPAPTAPPAPAAHHLQPRPCTQAWHTDSGDLITAEGVLIHTPDCHVKGVAYALQRDGSTAYLLTARGEVDFERFIGRRVAVTGTKLQSASAADSVLEVTEAPIAAQE